MILLAYRTEVDVTASSFALASRETEKMLSPMTSLEQCLLKEKGRDLTQSYDKSPNTNRKIEKATRQHKTPQKLRLLNDCGPT